MQFKNLIEIKLITKKRQIKEVFINEGKIKALTKYRHLYKGHSLVDAKRYLDKLEKEIKQSK